MKKLSINYLFALLAAFTTVFTSCTKDEDATPTVTKPAISSYTAKLVGAQNNAAGSFFSSLDGVVYFTKDSADFNTKKVDVSFAQTGVDAPGTPKFISLSNRKSEGLRRVTTIANSTYFKVSAVTAAQFDTISFANTLITNIVKSDAQSIAIEQGKVYEFVNSDNKRGLIKVANLVTGTNFDGSVTIDVKVEK